MTSEVSIEVVIVVSGAGAGAAAAAGANDGGGVDEGGGVAMLAVLVDVTGSKVCTALGFPNDTETPSLLTREGGCCNCCLLVAGCF